MENARLRVTDPRAAMATDLHMPQNLVENYGWEATDSPESCGYLAPKVLSILAGLGVHRVMDLGAGNGALCGDLAQAGYNVVGVEYDGQGVRMARTEHPNIPFYNYGVQDDPAELLRSEPPFDAVVSTEVIEHLFSPHLLPRYAAAVLRDGGYLVVTTPYHGYLKNLAIAALGKWDSHHDPLWHGGHVKFWSRPTLSTLLVENGFRIVTFGGVGRVPYLWKSMVLVAMKA
jgi:2-polyprenyl-3-methyl-5-hydroxy-6-metoxy-1,4-benzoquinol methylase